MHNHVTTVHQDPTVVGLAFQARGLAKFGFDFLSHCILQRLQHAVTGAGANDEKIGENGLFPDIQEQDIFPFAIFQNIDNAAREF